MIRGYAECSVSRDMLEDEVGDRLYSVFEFTKWYLGPSTYALGEGGVDQTARRDSPLDDIGCSSV